jgi:hypothetical protein
MSVRQAVQGTGCLDRSMTDLRLRQVLVEMTTNYYRILALTFGIHFSALFTKYK